MDLHDIFSDEGLLSQTLSGFTPRASQHKMAEAVALAIQASDQLIVEAGTGTGKTFAYLIPVFLAGKKTILSTGTRALQDQLFFKDIPVIRDMLASPLRIALLKGRANYLCHHRLEQSVSDGRFDSRDIVHQLHDVKAWSGVTQSGDISELTTIPEESSLWPKVTSTTDNCLGQECPFIKNCFVMKARQAAMSADIVIVNHHLFFADVALQENGFGEILPNTEVIIFDEAHHLPELASQFFSTKLTGRQLFELARDTETEALTGAPDVAELPVLSTRLISSTQSMRLALSVGLQRAPWPEQKSETLSRAIQHVKIDLNQLEAALKICSVRSKGLENVWRRTHELIELFNLLTGETSENSIHWFETHTQSFTIQLTPMVVAEQFNQFLSAKKNAYIFTSATLTANNRFDVFTETLGLNQTIKMQLDSPFDYKTQSILYVPRGLPDPRSSDFISTLADAALPVIELTQGRAFILCTSFRAVDEIAERFKEKNLFQLFVQGTKPKKNLLESFIQSERAVLIGTSSFWQGVDVRGEALSCVIIDKLPFASPDDPVLQARLQRLRRQGVDPFQRYQLPQAALTLKQGAGRLIRDAADRGILMIGDPRLVAARYAPLFLRSLPNMSRTRDFETVKMFWEEENFPL
ncbi:MAG: ATP-dependent DNA helicase [Gammaproteobacteria bacterium]|nr:ATP-dependent DNA helicase [Gammaproteobacteria bacterium]